MNHLRIMQIEIAAACKGYHGKLYKRYKEVYRKRYKEVLIDLQIYDNL